MCRAECPHALNRSHRGRQFEGVEVVVDTGSTYTAVPREMLQRLGVPVERSLPSETQGGRTPPLAAAHGKANPSSKNSWRSF